MAIFNVAVPFADHLAVEAVLEEPGRVVVALDLKPAHLNSWQVAHGGVTMTLLDIALSFAARSSDPAAVSAPTVEMKVSFVAAGRGRLTAEGRVLKAGRSLAFCEGEVRDGAGELVAKALGTFALRRAKPES